MKRIIVPDLEGHLSLLKKIRKKFPNHNILLSGDCIDRGPNSSGVIDFLINDLNSNLVLGNHEHMFVSCYEEAVFHKQNKYNILNYIYLNGGKQTLESYGARIPSIDYLIDLSTKEAPSKMNFESPFKTLKSSLEYIKSDRSDIFGGILNEFNLIKKDHIDFLKTRETCFEDDQIFVTHAPINNWKMLDKFTDIDLINSNDFILDTGCLWSRVDPKKPHPKGKLYIYGHQNKNNVMFHTSKHPSGSYNKSLDTTISIPPDCFAICLDTIKKGWLNVLDLENMIIHRFEKDSDEK